MANNKVELSDGTVVMDITDTTATPEDLKKGKTAYGADGEKMTGAANSDAIIRGVPNAEWSGQPEIGVVFEDAFSEDDGVVYIVTLPLAVTSTEERPARIGVDGETDYDDEDPNLRPLRLKGSSDYTITAGSTVTMAYDATNQRFDIIAMDSWGGGDSNVFVAEYGATTFDELKAAYDAGNVCLVKYEYSSGSRTQNCVGLLQEHRESTDDEVFKFTCYSFHHNTMIYIGCYRNSYAGTEVWYKDNEIRLVENNKTYFKVYEGQETDDDQLLINIITDFDTSGDPVIAVEFSAPGNPGRNVCVPCSTFRPSVYDSEGRRFLRLAGVYGENLVTFDIAADTENNIVLWTDRKIIPLGGGSQLPQYQMCNDDVGGNVVQKGEIDIGGTTYGIYEFFYKTTALPNATSKAYNLTNILANYSVNNFIDATGITSNGIFIGNGRTDNDNRVIVQQFSKNNKTVTLRAYQNFSNETATLKIQFIGIKS